MKKQTIIVLFIFVLTALLAGCAEKAVWKPLFDTPEPGRTSGLVTPKPIDADQSAGEDTSGEPFQKDAESMESPRIIATKSNHTLELWDGDELMARITMAYGRGEEGPKRKNGDNKTPEGDYFVCKTDENSRYYKSFFLSYPNSDDANAGVTDGTIDQETADKITEDIENRKQPQWDTAMGGEIAICGVGTVGKGKSGDWTAGNIVISDKDMDYLWKYIKVGTDVIINP